MMLCVRWWMVGVLVLVFVVGGVILWVMLFVVDLVGVKDCSDILLLFFVLCVCVVIIVELCWL